MTAVRGPVTVVGDQALAALVSELLGRDVDTRERLASSDPGQSDPGPIVVVRGEGGPPHDARLHEAAERAGAPLLPVRHEYDAILVGPWIDGGAWPCLRCLARRRHRALVDAAQRRRIHHHLPDGHPRPLATGAHLRETAAAVVAHHIDRLDDAAITRGAVTRIADATLTVSTHRYLADPLCPRCGQRPPDRASAAEVTLQPRPKRDPTAWREGPIAERADDLVARFVDPQCGMVRALVQDTSASLPSVSAPMGIGDGDVTELSGGQHLSYDTSRLTGIAEALERYAGIAPRGRAAQVRGSFAELRDVAIDPTDLGLHDPAAYERVDSRFRPYSPDAVCDWTWAYSFGRGEPVLIPLDYVYVGQRHEGLPTRDARFAYEISNGCALGGSLEEALLHGLFEVAERDAFLLTWYARLPVPELELRGHERRSVRVLTERLERDAGISVRAFDIGLDLLPAVWVMAVDEEDRPGHPKAVCAAAAHLDPTEALGSALLELATVRATAHHEYGEDPESVAELVADSTLVRRMADHLRVYAHPDAFERLDFLTCPPRRHEPRERPAPPGPSADVTADLRWTLEVFGSAGVDVVVVDQTTPELREAGLTAVKAIGVGALPMTFGHHLRRVRGLPRLREVPVALGYRSAPLAEQDLNPWPHPFP